MNHQDRERKLQALRNLAERPGTEAEGKVAREMLDRLEPKVKPASSEETKAYGVPPRK